MTDKRKLKKIEYFNKHKTDETHDDAGKRLEGIYQ